MLTHLVLITLLPVVLCREIKPASHAHLDAILANVNNGKIADENAEGSAYELLRKCQQVHATGNECERILNACSKKHVTETAPAGQMIANMNKCLEQSLAHTST